MLKEVLFFTAKWCGPCKAIKSWKDNSKYKDSIKLLDIEEDEDSVDLYGIRSVPTQVFLKDPNEVFRHVGAVTQTDFELTFDRIYNDD